MRPRGRVPHRPTQRGQTLRPGLHYDPNFVSAKDANEIRAWLRTLHPLWELRYSTRRRLPEGQTQRQLLRPVYWLGGWQFACLGYYRPPEGVRGRCVRAEPFPPVLAKLVARIEDRAEQMYHGADMPARWNLNTCLVNFYGTRLQDGRNVDTARVGEHRDFEPGPVASISLGERALFQFAKGRMASGGGQVVFQQWLDDGSLQIFGGERWKRQTLHRVQRVDRRDGHTFELAVPDFKTRRVNFTFRYVPEEHIERYGSLAADRVADIQQYIEELAKYSEFFAGELRAATSR